MNKKSITTISIMGLTLLGALFSGCGSDKDMVIASVNGDKIYAQDLNDIFNRSRMSFASFDDEFQSRRDIVDSLVIQQLLIQAAYQKNIDEVEEVKRIILANSEKFLLDILYQAEVMDKVEVTEEEIKDFYSMLEYKVHAFHIVVKEKDTAMMIMDSLKQGGIFEDLAVRYSIETQAKTNRGDLGYFIWGQMDPEFQEQVFKLEPGQISEPFETRFGWHIAKLVDKAPNELRGNFEKMADQIKRSLENARRNERLAEYRNELMEKYPINIDTVTCQYLLHKREVLYPPSLLEQIPKNDFDVSQLDRHEKELVLATWDGGQLSAGQYLGQIKRIRPEMKPDFDDYEALSEFIFKLSFESILGVEARRIGLEDDDRYQRKITRFKELTMADIMENDSIPPAAPPDEGEIRQYYEENENEFLIPAKAQIYEILFSDYAAAKTYAGKIPSLERFKSLAKQHTTRAGKRAVGGDLGWIDSRSFPKYFNEAQQNEVGKVVGPIQIGSNYALIYIADKKEEEVKDFLMVKQQIYDTLDRQKRRRAFEDWVEEKKANANIQINENNIRATINQALYESPDSLSS